MTQHEKVPKTISDKKGEDKYQSDNELILKWLDWALGMYSWEMDTGTMYDEKQKMEIKSLIERLEK